MKRIRNCLSLTIVVFLAVVGYAVDSVIQNTIDKLQNNFDRIQDLKVTVITYVENSNSPDKKTIQKIIYTFKKPDKLKIEYIEPAKHTIIVSSNSKNLSYPMSDSVINIFKTRCWPGPVFIYEPKEYLNNFDLTVKDEINNISIFNVVSKNSQNNNTGKMEWYVDTINNLTKKVYFYDIEGSLWRKIEILEYQFVKDKIWFPVKIIDTITSQMNQVKKEINYSEIEINTGISDNEFYTVPLYKP